MRAKPLPTTFKENSYLPTGLRPIIINFLINLVYEIYKYFVPGVQISWVADALVTVHAMLPSLTILFSATESKPLPVITIEFLEPIIKT